ncbi:MAG: hypothetical protein KAW13_06600 [Dehalococcoidia bacterium]|nr:hypothetical protein [Dehalococcoidia bacterium]
MLRIESIEIDDHILDKIESKHSISFYEIEEGCFSTRRHIRRGKEGLYKTFSQTAAGRYILIVLINLGGGVWRIVTAREMTSSERRQYVKATGGK